MNKKVDKGPVVFRKKILFKIKRNLTFKKSYNILVKEIEKLFIKNYSKLISGNYSKKKIKLKGSFHRTSQLPKDIENWNIKIFDYLKNHNN